MRGHIVFSPFGVPGKVYEIKEDPDVSASFPFFFIPFSFTLPSPSGKLTTSGGLLSPNLVPT